MRPRTFIAAAVLVAATATAAPLALSDATPPAAHHGGLGKPATTSDCSDVQYPEFAGKAAYYAFHSDKLIFEIKPWSELSLGKQTRWARAAQAAVDFNCHWHS